MNYRFKSLLFLLFFTTVTSSCRTVSVGGGLGFVPIAAQKENQMRALTPEQKEEQIQLKLVNFYHSRQRNEEDYKDCKEVWREEGLKNVKIPIRSELRTKIKRKAIELKADQVLFLGDEDSLDYKILQCDRFYTAKKILKNRAYSESGFEFSLLAGSYFSRQGILKELGNPGPTMGLQLKFFGDLYAKDEKFKKHGFFVLWTFDHFFDTNSELLKPKFYNEDYTNYMLAGGYSFRDYISPRIMFQGDIGLAVNFLEIDTFGGGSSRRENNDYTDTTFSAIAKVGFDYRFGDMEVYNGLTKAKYRIGPSLLYYYSADPLAGFANDDKESGLLPGGSYAWYLEFGWNY